MFQEDESWVEVGAYKNETVHVMIYGNLPGIRHLCELLRVAPLGSSVDTGHLVENSTGLQLDIHKAQVCAAHLDATSLRIDFDGVSIDRIYGSLSSTERACHVYLEIESKEIEEVVISKDEYPKGWAAKHSSVESFS